ncbi:MAG: J domain-containing protein [Clostridia bacterium]|nr:J domain-containing protein [Clostridia bacterium]
MNPYQVLGISENATDDEVRAAYIKLVKEYHPDKYQDNPLKDLADEKLKEINQAYDMIQKERSGGGSGGYSGGASARPGYSSGNSYSGAGSGSTYSGEYADQFSRVRELLNGNDVARAKAVLEGISARNAEWHYLYGVTLFRMGQYSNARSHLDMATQMDPSNPEYRSAFTATSSRGTRNYHTYGGETTRGSGSGLDQMCSTCATIWCCESCCECMGNAICNCR